MSDYGKSSVSMVDAFLLASAMESNAKKQVLTMSAPPYAQTGEFQLFLKNVEANVEENLGYMFIVLDKHLYRPGDKVSGKIYFELYIPSESTQVNVKFEGRETVPESCFKALGQKYGAEMSASYKEKLKQERSRKSMRQSQ